LDYPVFVYPKKFALISGLSEKEIRKLCLQQEIPNERTKRGFRIDVKGALTVLQTRAADFIGHPRIVHRIMTQPLRKSPLGKGNSFQEALKQLKAEAR